MKFLNVSTARAVSALSRRFIYFREPSLVETQITEFQLIIKAFDKMKILDAKAGALTNFEVLDLLRSRGAGNDPTRVIASVSPSEFKVFDYLEKSPACNQTRDIIQMFVDACKKFDLAKAEILNIINARPSQMVEVYQIIEDCDLRMDDDTINELVDTVSQILPSHQSSEETAEENNENEEIAEENNENEENNETTS